MTLVELADYAVLFREGEQGTNVYVVEEGAAASRREFSERGYELVATPGPDVYVDELASIFGHPRSPVVCPKAVP